MSSAVKHVAKRAKQTHRIHKKLPHGAIDNYMSKEGYGLADMVWEEGDWKPDRPVETGPTSRPLTEDDVSRDNQVRRRRQRRGRTVLDPEGLG
jgi:hypothetical protein